MGGWVHDGVEGLKEAVVSKMELSMPTVEAKWEQTKFQQRLPNWFSVFVCACRSMCVVV